MVAIAVTVNYRNLLNDVLCLNAEDFATREELLEAIATRSPQSFDAIIPTMLSSVEESLGTAGEWLIGLVLILVLAASMSTLSSLAMTSASTITLDLIAPLSKKKLSEKACTCVEDEKNKKEIDPRLAKLQKLLENSEKV